MQLPKLHILFLPLALLAASIASAQDNSAVRIEKAINYLPAGRTEQADLYLPPKFEDGKKYPGVVIIHGGGWTGGKRDAAREIKCPSMVLFGGQDRTSTFPIQVKVMENFHANGQPLEWHYFHFGNHGFASTESDGYQPYLADLAWPLVTEFLRRELIGPAL